MKKSNHFTSMFSLSFAALLFLFSFSPKPGGEGFEVFQNNKLVLHQFGGDMKTVKSLQLNASSIKDEITVRYYHCGRVGKNRHIILRSNDNKELKNWTFADMSAKDAGMSFKAGDVISLTGKNKKSTVNVYYTSSELPSGRLLVSLIVNG